MKDRQWKYPNIDRTAILKRITTVESFLQKYGAEFIGVTCERRSWQSKGSPDICWEMKQNVWKKKNDYIRVDYLLFDEKPFLVLELSDQFDGPYEDADPFPYDLRDADLEEIIRTLES